MHLKALFHIARLFVMEQQEVDYRSFLITIRRSLMLCNEDALIEESNVLATYRFFQNFSSTKKSIYRSYHCN